jgi:hypothetical protein
MKYTKYALALVLLASSAFASGSLSDLANEISTHSSKPKNNSLDRIKNSMTKSQFEAIRQLATTDRKNKNLVLEALIELEKIEKEKEKEKEREKEKEKEEPIVPGSGNDGVNGTELEPEEKVDKILKLTGDNVEVGKSQEIEKFLNVDQIAAIKYQESQLNGKITKDLLEKILGANDEELKTLSEGNFQTNEEQPQEFSSFSAVNTPDALGDNAADLSSGTSDPAADTSSGVSTAPGGSGAAFNPSSSAADGSNDADIINTDNNDQTKQTNPENSSIASAESSAKKVETDTLAKGTSSQKDSTKSTTPAPPAPDAIKEKAKSILAKVQGDGKLSASTKESFGILVTDELFAAIKSKEDATAKRILEDELVEVIKGLEAAVEQKKKAEQEQKDKEAAKQALIAKIKAALANVKDFSELTTDAIKDLGLTDKQVEALKKAKVTKDTSDAEIEKILNGKAEATTSSGSSTVTDSGTEKGKNAEIPFYKNPWIMVPSGLILLSAIGGGVFMMTRKTEDTDL